MMTQSLGLPYEELKLKFLCKVYACEANNKLIKIGRLNCCT